MTFALVVTISMHFMRGAKQKGDVLNFNFRFEKNLGPPDGGVGGGRYSDIFIYS